MASAVDDQRERISELAERLRASGSLGRSDLMNRLFDFLLEQSLAGRSPKEVEVAREVFGKDAQFDMTQDASVRVYIHRLRRKLEEVDAGTTGDRLNIPRGEYRLTVERAEVPAAADEDMPSPVPVEEEALLPEVEAEPAEAEKTPARPWLQRVPRRSWQMVAALCLAMAIGLGIGALLWSPHARLAPASPLAGASLWRPLAESNRPTFVVAGDYYIFGEAPNTVQVTRLVREFSINSREDLDGYLMSHPDDYGRYVDLDLHYLPVSAGYALRDLAPPLESFARGGPMRVTTMSRLTPEILKSANIVYVGFLSSLGLLRDPLFGASDFSIGASYDELIDRATGKHYVSTSEDMSGGRTPRRDFAYLASFPGPSGNRIVVVAGTRDPAVMQAAEVAVDRAQLDRVAAKAGNDNAFEALYEVRTLGTVNLGSTLVLARPLKTDRLWRPGNGDTPFPDEMPFGGGGSPAE